MFSDILSPRSALYVPATNAKALAKVATLGADMVIVELEDAVRADDKDAARGAAVDALKGDFGVAIKALRINAAGTAWHQDDVEAAAASGAQLIVVPKVESASAIAELAGRIGHPVLAMIETPQAVLNAAAIAAAPGVAGLIAGLNDLAHGMKMPADPERQGLMVAVQTMILAARAANGWILDGVYNAIVDADGFQAECAQGRRWGFDGKTLIHPSQVAPANSLFAPSEAEIDDARALLALVDAASADGNNVGAIRFHDRMVEDMHIKTARAILARTL